MNRSLAQKYARSKGVRVAEVCQRQKNFLVLQPKFVCDDEKRGRAALHDSCLASQRNQKAAVLSIDFPLWRVISARKLPLFHRFGQLPNMLNQGRLLRGRGSFLLAKVHSLTKFGTGSHGLPGCPRGFSTSIASNLVVMSNSHMPATACFVFVTVNFLAHFTSISQELDTQIRAGSDRFDRENPFTQIPLTMIWHDENAIPTYSMTAVTTKKIRCRQKISPTAASTASSCVVYQRALLRRTARGPLASVGHGEHCRG